jgi:hypothetical protein
MATEDEATEACAECGGAGLIEGTEDPCECAMAPFERVVAERVRLNGGLLTRYIQPRDPV